MSLTGPRPPRTLLFVPATRPDRFPRAATSGADEMIVDLEDSVDDGQKDEARVNVVRWLEAGNRSAVRINGLGTSWFDRDLEAVRDLPGLRCVVVPKAEDPRILSEIADRLGPTVAIVALVESASGVLNAARIASAAGVTRLAFGSIDFAVDVGCSHTRDALLLARSTLVLASRSAGIAAPIDGVTTALDNPDDAREDTIHARSLGFRGKLCIHPSQVAAVHEAFAPSAEDIAWAKRVLTASGGAARVDGEMVDKPVLERARSIIAMTTERAG